MLQGARASKGIIFTASAFSPDAHGYAANVSPRVILIDGERLAELMIDHKVGVTDRETYAVRRVESRPLIARRPRPSAGANAETHLSPVPPWQSPSVPGAPFGSP